MIVLLQVVVSVGGAALLVALAFLIVYRISRHYHLKTAPVEVKKLVGWQDLYNAASRAYPELKKFRGRCPYCYGSQYLYKNGSLFLNHLNEEHMIPFAEAADLLEKGLS